MINHSAGVYVEGEVYTNTIEGFFGNLKTGMRGASRPVSRKWLQSYLDEYAWRYNQRHRNGRSMFHPARLTGRRRNERGARRSCEASGVRPVAVKSADAAKRQATEDLRAFCQQAQEAGVSITRIASEAGLSRQGVYDLLGERPSS